jgi:hypothetical protein
VRPWALPVPTAEELPGAVAKAVAEHTAPDRRLAVIAPDADLDALAVALPEAARGMSPDLTQPVVLLAPAQAKGLEFDTVLVVEPDGFGANELYVALTRATQRMGVLHTAELPYGLELETA